MRFRLGSGVSEVDFRAADARLQTEFAYQQPGLWRRTTARRDDGEWVVIDVWRSPADADAGAARWDSDPAVRDFLALLDRSSVQVSRFEELGG
jgi:hypothetical protein